MLLDEILHTLSRGSAMVKGRASMCPICGGAAGARCRSQNPVQDLFSCLACVHSFVPAVSAEANRRTQLESFGEAFAGRAGVFVRVYEELNAKRAAAIMGVRRGWKVLEIGPGSGATMAEFAARGCEVRGIDLSESVARQVSLRRGIPVSVESLEAHLGAGGPSRYDAIIMQHVLEHFDDPLAALTAVRALLKEGGRLYVAVPNMASWNSRFPGWPGYEPYHLHYFSARSLSAALSRSGLAVVDIRTYESLSGWTNTLYRTARRSTAPGAAPSSSRAGTGRIVMEALRFGAGVVTTPLRWCQAALGRGEELIVVAEKGRG